MAKILGDKYKIVLIGVSNKQKNKMLPNMLGIEKTNDMNELIQWYSGADVFINFTYEDNYPTVNLEAQACGTPVITYRTGGSVESVPKENIIEVSDIYAAKKLLETDKLKINTEIMDRTLLAEMYMKIYKL